MKYRVGNNVICSILVVVISLLAEIAFPAESTYRLTHFLKTTEPVKLPASESIKTKGETIADNIHNADWDAPLLRSPKGFEALRYAYEHQLVDKNEFLDAQDYLQIQADFAALETEAFQILVDTGRLPARVPAVTVKRIFYTNIAAWKQPDIFRSEGALAGEQFGWLTVVQVASNFFSEYKALKNAFLSNQVDRSGDFMKCLARYVKDERQQLMYWYQMLELNLKGLVWSTSDEGRPEIVIGSIPLYLAFMKKTSWYFLDFTPFYGQLDWNDLIEMRVAGVNPGTIYHPDVISNYFYPHHLYGGASVFARHDLIHHQILGMLSESHRRFMAWMHQQEEVILKKMDRAMVAFNHEDWEAVYNETSIPETGVLVRLCCSEQPAQSHLHGEKHPILPATHYWANPGNHRTLFPGQFADSAFLTFTRPLYEKLRVLGLEAWSPPFINWHSTFQNLLEEQCENAGYYFSASFDLYHALLDKVLTENRAYIWQTFWIDVDELLMETNDSRSAL